MNHGMKTMITVIHTPPLLHNGEVLRKKNASMDMIGMTRSTKMLNTGLIGYVAYQSIAAMAMMIDTAVMVATSQENQGIRCSRRNG